MHFHVSRWLGHRRSGIKAWYKSLPLALSQSGRHSGYTVTRIVIWRSFNAWCPYSRSPPQFPEFGSALSREYWCHEAEYTWYADLESNPVPASRGLRRDGSHLFIYKVTPRDFVKWRLSPESHVRHGQLDILDYESYIIIRVCCTCGHRNIMKYFWHG